jgi:hypothetical protein
LGNARQPHAFIAEDRLHPHFRFHEPPSYWVYAGWFNRKYKRHGQLFQNRYKSICFPAEKGKPVKATDGFMENGISEGKRPDLTGGGLLRSIDGWIGLKNFRKAGIRVKGDERILGDSDFVETVLASAREALNAANKMKKSIDSS